MIVMRYNERFLMVEAVEMFPLAFGVVYRYHMLADY